MDGSGKLLRLLDALRLLHVELLMGVNGSRTAHHMRLRLAVKLHE